jgi:hypothetical protein
MRAGLAFFVGAWAGWVVAAAVSVYGLGRLVHPYNASASFLIVASASVLPSLAVFVGALLGALGVSIPWRTLAFPAAAMALLCALVYFAAEAIGPGTTAVVAVGMVLVWVVLPAAAGFWARRLARGGGNRKA